jgi:unsaturated rhamnogalacturonyl hydrolase
MLLAVALAGAGCDNTYPVTTSAFHGHIEAPDTSLNQTPAPVDNAIATAAVPTPSVASPSASSAHTPDAVLQIMRQAADWQLGNPTVDPENGWVYAAFYDGVLALAKINQDPKYYDVMMAQGVKNHWQLGTHDYNADDHAVGQMYLELYELKNDPGMVQPTRQRFDEILDYPKDDNLDYTRSDKNDRWSWCDALFMDPPVWARLSKVTGDPKYLDSANRRWWVTSNYLYDKDEHLYYRDSTFFTQREPNGGKIFWSRGNGWVIAGLARLLDYMPADYPDRAKYVRQFREMTDRVKSLQQADGLWRTGLLDPASHPQKETSGSGFFTYALAWGINQGLLDRATYEPVVLKGWDALTQSVQPNGKLIHVQPVGAQPSGFPENSSTPYGVGAFLLAGSEVYKLEGGK